MKTVYIQFEMPQNLKKRKENSLKRFIKNTTIFFLKIIIPEANPDFEKEIDHVRFWLIECEQASGTPQREIGLDKQHRVIAKMPFGKNCGYWTDNNLLLDDFKKHFIVIEINKEIFERQWVSFDTSIKPHP